MFVTVVWCGVVWCGEDHGGMRCWAAAVLTLSVLQCLTPTETEGCLPLRADCRRWEEEEEEEGGQSWTQSKFGHNSALVTVSSSLPLSLPLSRSLKKMVSSKTIKYFCLTGAGVTSSQSNKTQQEITFFLQPSHCASARSIKMIFLTEKMKFVLVVVS